MGCDRRINGGDYTKEYRELFQISSNIHYSMFERRPSYSWYAKIQRSRWNWRREFWWSLWVRHREALGLCNKFYEEANKWSFVPQMVDLNSCSGLDCKTDTKEVEQADITREAVDATVFKNCTFKLLSKLTEPIALALNNIYFYHNISII